MLDALTAPVHRDGEPSYLTPGVELYVGDVRNRDLLANLLRRTDAVYHFAAYQDYLPDFATFVDVNVRSTALIYEIVGRREARPPTGRGGVIPVRDGRGPVPLPGGR